VSEPFVEVTRTDAAAVIAFRREAKLNALSTAVEAQLGDALEHPDVRSAPVVVITGGPRAFSAGADVNEMGDMDPAAILAYYRQTGGVYERVARMPQPTIAAISGFCIGGGFELALATDFRVADDSAVFGLPEVAIGILPSSGGTLRLVRMLGTARAKELILIGERFGADRALALGIVTEVAATSLEGALDLAGRLAAQPALAVSVAKQVIDATPDASAEAALALERLAYGMLGQTGEHGAATSEFVARRAERRGPA
jgi:enoyl-CoA hydratase/carnithine racemase